MRALFLSWPAAIDPSNSAARSLRTMARWLADAGHEVTMLSGGVYRAPVELGDELKPLGVSGSGRYRSGSRSLVMFNDGGVKTNFICTVARDEAVEATDIRTFVSHGQRLVRDFRPQLVVYMGGERGVTEVVRLARNSSSRVLGTAWEFGWERKEAFISAHQVVCGSRFLANHYRTRIGLNSLGFPPPMDLPQTDTAEKKSVVLVTQTNPLLGAPAVMSLRERGYKGTIRIEGRFSDWKELVSQEGVEFLPSPKDRGALWSGVSVALTISIDAAGISGAEAVLNQVPLVADRAGPNEETSGGFGRFLEASPENGVAWAQAVENLLQSPPDSALAEQTALKFYAPEVQRHAYVQLMERVQAP